MADRWTITHQKGWLRFDDDASITAVEAERVACFGTTLHGFVVNTNADTLFFEANPVHARACVERLWEIWTAP